jgi:H+/Cl- antiporter ClcA
MLPLDQTWYRRLLGYAFALGLTAGAGALLYMGVTGAAGDFLFDATGTGWWEGAWWWVPLVAIGGLIVAVLRRRLEVPDEIPGAVAMVGEGWLDSSAALRLIGISAVSLIFGASLGPSFGLISLGGGLGAWVVTRFGDGVDNEQSRHDFVLTGMAGSLGGTFSAPIFGAVLVSELSPTSKHQYVTAFIPQLIAATIGYVVFFGITGSSMLDAYELPPYRFQFSDLAIGVILGVLSVLVLLLLMSMMKVAAKVARLVRNSYWRGLLGGAVVGLTAFALPLTLTSGSSQLATLTENPTAFGAGFLAAVIIGKMLAVTVSLNFGFLGGNVFPALFIGGSSGLLVHAIVPEISVALAVAAMMAAVPGAFLRAPLSLVLIAAGTVGVGPAAVAPIAIAVVTAYLFTAVVTQVLESRSAPAASE